MRKPAITAQPMVTDSPVARPWCSRDSVTRHGRHAGYVAVATGFAVTHLHVGNGIVRLEGLEGGSG